MGNLSGIRVVTRNDIRPSHEGRIFLLPKSQSPYSMTSKKKEGSFMESDIMGNMTNR